MSWGVKNTFFEAPGVSLGGSGVSIGGVKILRQNTKKKQQVSSGPPLASMSHKIANLRMNHRQQPKCNCVFSLHLPPPP